MHLWRISKFPTLDGEGGRLYPARWNSGGQPVTYLAASPPGALLEILVHLYLNGSTLPPAYTLLEISSPSSLRISTLKVPAGEAWKTNDTLTRKLGDVWLTSKRSALARVPSAILPETFNFLFNPLHPDARRIKIAKVHPAFLDARLLRNPRTRSTHPLQ
ncbi:MAG: RES family NAD+ phosphorylase [Acidobacteriota bacterium]